VTGRPASALALGVAVAACSGGPGLAKQQPGETYPGDRRAIEGTLGVVEGRCLRLRLADGADYLVIWPSSASQGNDGYVSLGWFQQDREIGDRVGGTGALTSLEALPHWQDGNWHAALGWCAKPDDSQAIVFDSVQRLGQ
jgi:hypothetical protein